MRSGKGAGGGETLLERDRELDELRGAIADVHRRGTGQLVLIEGAPGIGKTRLLREAERIAAADMGLLSARGSEVEREFAFGVVHQLLEPALPSGAAARRGLAGRSAAPVERVLAPSSPPGGTDVSYAVLHGLYSLVASLCESAPRLIAIDDAHWADAASLRFIGFLARRLDGLPLALVLTARSVDPGRSRDPLAELEGVTAAATVAPRPLSESAVGRLATAGLGGPPEEAVVRTFHQATGGNPFLLNELLTELRASTVPAAELSPESLRDFGPRRVASAVLRRVAGLGEDAPRLAQAVAVLGDGAELRCAVQLAGIDGEEAAGAADALAGADVLLSDQPLRFVHPLVRAALYDAIPAAAREDAHRRAAELLSAMGAPAERVAAHLLRTEGRGDREAVETLREAARRAIDQAAPESAVRYLERALAEPPDGPARGPVLTELGSAEMLVDGAAARRHLADAVAASEEPLQRAEAANALAWALFFAGRTADAAEVSSEAAEAVTQRSPALRGKLEVATLVAALHEPSLTRRATEISADVKGRPVEDDAGRALLALAGWHDARSGDPRAIEQAEAALLGGSLLEGDNGGTPMLAGYTLALADRDAGLEAFERGVALAHEQGSTFAFACHKLFAGRARHLRGELREAIADIGDGLRATPIAIGAIWGESWLADALLDAGEVEAAALALARLEAGADPPRNGHWLWYLDSLSKVELRRGDARAALEAALRCGGIYEELGGRNPALVSWRSQAALAHLELGEVDRARPLAAAQLEAAREWGAPRALGTALRTVARTEERDRRADLLGEAVRVLRPSPARLALAEALCELGAELRRARRRAESQPPLREALSLAARCGAAPLEARAREELLAAGARPRRALLHGPESLTAAELRVAGRAARGMSNREIAGSLFVTRKTVEYHLSNVYRKLEIGSRAELGAALGAEDGDRS